MKKIYTLILLSAVGGWSNTATSQSPNWLWAKSAGGNAFDVVNGLTVDGSGNSYITGTFGSPTITFGSTTLTNASIASDIFIAKYDAAGNALWAIGAGGTSGENGISIFVDGSGNSYVTGMFMSLSITFGATTLTNAGPGGADIFVVKLDASGNTLWAIRAGGTNSDYGLGITADGSGNSYITGVFASQSITFGTTTLTNASAGSNDIFIAKYDAAGNALWAKKAGGSSGEMVNSIAVDGSGNSFITGDFASPSITFGTTTLTNVGSNDIFIAKYDAAGNALWANSAGGSNGESGQSIRVDGSGNSFITGKYQSSSITFGSTTLTNAGVLKDDIFIAKYRASGNVLWAAGAGGIESDGAKAIALDGSGNYYVAGSFQSLSITLGTTTLTNAGPGSSDVFIVKYAPAGNVLWAKSAGGTTGELVNGIDVDGSGNSYLAGVFYSPSVTFGSTTLTNSGSGDAFVAKLASVVGINEFNSNEIILSVSPNPFTDELVVRNSEFGAKAKIKIQDIYGRLVYEQKPATVNRKLQTVNWQQGIYFVEVITEERRMVRKVVKQ